jgi:hypothetical protein
MCLAFRARESTRDVDAKFEPTGVVREAALRVAEREGISDRWLNDAVRSYLSDRETWSPFLERSHLRVFCADARYMLAMKCQAMRLGEGYHDEEDVRYLLRHLGLASYTDAERILADYYELDSYPPKALAAVRELTSGRR